MPRRAAIVLALLLAGCSRSAGRAARGTAADDSLALTALPETARGLVRVHGDTTTFQVCGAAAARPLVDRTGGDLKRAVASLAARPGDPLYVEVRGGVVPRAGVSASAAPFVVLALRRAAPGGESACAQPPGRWRYRARGNEPFWSVTVWHDSVVFEEPSRPTPLRFGAPTAIARGDTLWWNAASIAPRHRLDLAIVEQRCTDSMSGEITSFAAIATLDGRRLAGCAFEGLGAAAVDTAAAGAAR